MTQKKGKILIVDDQLNWREVFTAILGEEYDLKTAESYSVAEAFVSEEAFDVAILDIRLRDENVFDATGISLAQRIKTLQPHTRIVVVTGYSNSVKNEIVQQVADAYIEKAPEQRKFKVTEFKALIRKLVDQTLI